MVVVVGVLVVGERRGLMVNNFLVKEKVLFVIKDGFRNGEWEVVIWGGVCFDCWCIEEFV